MRIAEVQAAPVEIDQVIDADRVQDRDDLDHLLAHLGFTPALARVVTIDTAYLIERGWIDGEGPRTW